MRKYPSTVPTRVEQGLEQDRRMCEAIVKKPCVHGSLPDDDGDELKHGTSFIHEGGGG